MPSGGPGSTFSEEESRFFSKISCLEPIDAEFNREAAEALVKEWASFPPLGWESLGYAPGTHISEGDFPEGNGDETKATLGSECPF